MSHFFGVLPDDLQIHVLSVWLSENGGCGFIKSLSSLDLACSSEHQAALRFLFGALPPFTPQFEISPKLTVGYMQWLCSRGVAVKSLHVTGCDDEQQLDPELRLPAVESIFWKDMTDSTAHLLDAVLRSCPNATSLDFAGSCSVEFTPAVVALAAKVTVFVDRSKAISYQSLKAIGPQLKKLLLEHGVINANLMNLVHKFPLLEVLEIRIPKPTVVLSIIETCKHLREVLLPGSMFDERDIALLLAHKQIRRLGVNRRSPSSKDCLMFFNMMTSFPDRDYLRIGNCVYSPVEGILELSGCEIDGALMAMILGACKSVQFLRVHDASVRSDAVEVVQRELGAGLKRFALKIGRFEYFSNIQTCGPLVHSIELISCYCSDAILETMAAQCPQLESLTLFENSFLSSCGNNSPSITDEGMEQLLGGCLNLKELSLDGPAGMRITRKTLQSIVRHKLRLEWLALNSF